MWDEGQWTKVWHWNGMRAEQMDAVYIGSTSTKEHVFMTHGTPHILGREVFDTEVQAKMWGRGCYEARKLALEHTLNGMDE